MQNPWGFVAKSVAPLKLKQIVLESIPQAKLRRKNRNSNILHMSSHQSKLARDLSATPTRKRTSNKRNGNLPSVKKGSLREQRLQNLISS